MLTIPTLSIQDLVQIQAILEEAVDSTPSTLTEKRLEDLLKRVQGVLTEMGIPRPGRTAIPVMRLVEIGGGDHV